MPGPTAGNTIDNFCHLCYATLFYRSTRRDERNLFREIAGSSPVGWAAGATPPASCGKIFEEALDDSGSLGRVEFSVFVFIAFGRPFF